mmetsp:Transcript_661/g.1178  ORF Transcript_661/g.1178 Transcript_661/m.1178 type:complete len:545 (+) Transcript_661:128-1762(+)
MIEYDNGAVFGILFQISGSVVPSAIPIGLVTGSIGLALAILREIGKKNEWLKNNIYHEKLIENAIAIQIFASVLGYLLVVRTNMALSRWMEAISMVESMLSKWGDAFKALSGFFSGKKDTPERMKRIQLFRARVAHWFSLMACLAFATLRGGRIGKLDDVPIKVMLHPEDPNTPKLKKKMSFAVSRQSDMDEGATGLRTSMSSDPIHRSMHSKVIDNRDEDRTKLINDMDLVVLYSPTPDEVQALDHANDKVNIVSLWIIQGIVLEVRAKTLDAPPPIVTRILQELSAGMLGFNQAHKVAMTPFPFPFAQMVSVLLLLMDLIFPFYVDAFTQHVVVTPIISFLIPLCYHGLNNTAIELEEPFGTDWNDVDIENRNEAYQKILIDALRMPTVPPYEEEWPKKEATRFERQISRNVCRQTQWLIERHPESKWQWDIFHLINKPIEKKEIESVDEDSANGSPLGITNRGFDELKQDAVSEEGPPSWAEESNQEETNVSEAGRKDILIPELNDLLPAPFSSCESPNIDCCTAGHDRQVIPARLPPPAS